MNASLVDCVDLSFEDFLALKDQGFNRIPLSVSVRADLDTPLSVYLKLARGGDSKAGAFSYLFESVEGGEQWGRYSFIGLPCSQRVVLRGHELSHFKDGVCVRSQEVDDPLQAIADFRDGFKVAPTASGLRFSGGLVGYFGYDTVRFIEPKLASSTPPDRLGNPDVLLLVSDELAVFDKLADRVHLIVHVEVGEGSDEDLRAAFDAACARLAGLVEGLHQGQGYPLAAAQASVAEEDFVSGFTEAGFKAAVERIKEYIVEGDVMQVVLSQRLSVGFEGDALDLYRALRSLNPSPYLYFLDMADFQIVGSSPEILVRLEEETVTVRPIAGTRRRGHDAAEDQAMEEELLNDPKELAEHLMLIDLGRNDAGRVAQTGTVELTDKMVVERYSHVMHIVSNVSARLADGLDAMDVLRATFPAGTVSGAPKIRAMEIIDELEPVKRGVYAGAVGYWDYSGNMDTAIAIRTALVQDGRLHIQAGAGVVYDSVPELEWKETMNKGRAVFRAVAEALAGVDRPQRVLGPDEREV